MMRNDRSLRIFFGSCAALVLVLGGYLQYELRSMAGERSGEYWRTASGTDFAVYYVAGRVASGEGDGRLYEGTPNGLITDVASPWLHVARAHGVVTTSPFQYPPFFALVVKPLAKLPLKTASFLWRQINTLSMLIAIYLALVIARAPYRFPLLVIAAAATLASFPFIEMKEMGQVGGLIFLLWTVGAYMAEKKRPVAGALCFALGTMIKLTPAFVVPLFILRRQWKWLLAYAGWITTLLAISVWQLGWANHATFFMQFMPAMSCGCPSARNKSVMNIVESLYYGDAFRDMTYVPSIPITVCWVGKLLSAGVLGLVLIAFYRRTKDAAHLGYEVALLALVSLLISPVTWRHHYVLALLPLILMWTAPEYRDRSKVRWPLLFAATVVIGTLLSHAMLQVARPLALQLCASMLMPAAAIAVLWLGLTVHSRSVSAATRPVDEEPSYEFNSHVSAAS